MIKFYRTGSFVKHKARGSTYEVIGTASVQATEFVEEGNELIIYRGEDGKFWARPVNEFEDGRFVPAEQFQQKVEATYQVRVADWLEACFGRQISCDKVERNHRLLEEVLEAVQSAGCTANEAHQLVDYVFSRPVGDIKQEVGGAMNTLAAFCLAHDLDMNECAEMELARVWTKVEEIREKQKTKPKNSPLPATLLPKDRLYIAEDALVRISGMRPLGDINKVKNTRSLVERMEAIAVEALRNMRWKK